MNLRYLTYIFSFLSIAISVISYRSLRAEADLDRVITDITKPEDKKSTSTGIDITKILKKKKDKKKKKKTVTVTKAEVSKNLTLALGISRTLKFKFDIGPIYLTDALVDYQRVKDGGKIRQILVRPTKEGLTDMTVHDRKGKPRVTFYVRVTREDTGRIIAQMEELIGDIEGIKIKSIDGTVIVDGDILLPKDMVRIIRVIDAMKDRDPKKKAVPIKNIASISKITMNIIASRIEREIGSPDITARVLNNKIFMEGTAQSEFEADRAIEIAKSYLPEVFVEKTAGEGGQVKPKSQGGNAGGLPTIIDLLRIAPRPGPPPSKDIKITMNYVELNNEYQKSFNFEWKPLASDQSTVQYSSGIGQVTANLVATLSNLLPKLVQESNHGHARILKQESVIVKNRSDQPAAIESAIDFYVRSQDERGQSLLQPVSVQNVTKVKAATIPGSDSIELGIQITLNSLLGSNQGAPIIAKNSLQTQVTIKNGDSAALGGYAIDEALSGYNRAPTQAPGGAGDAGQAGTPLFNLSRSKNYTHTKQQYIIFVTPEIIRTASAGTEDITRKFRLNSGEK